MKTTLRFISVFFALAMMVSVFAACGNNTPAPTNAPNPVETTAAVETTVPFIAPPDQIGLVTSADSQLVTWQAYETKEDTIDFKSVNVKTLGNPGEMSLVYMESEVTYYSLLTGSLEKTTIDGVVPGSVIGITTLEEGVMEVYILSVPAEEVDPTEDILEEIEEVTIPTETAASEPDVSYDDNVEETEGPSENDGI